ncbi:MAG: hypothetical protein UU64_C0002G0035 [candidate division WWE3 bacterium GW2011_GWF2_41_45]|uniref:Uncharacterized protein n=3 Tax=Katanobacteria TaxID=422282 RepID=A0A1F4W370_UNCKA|nr:MAG: hypothetical protein UU55_C0001G0083 [candidate division WWE3 bacterium GW2011_GWC2_41_23]KKS10633.1 MAG: hypothetical protein UU64_C0002G0035 [candidate division WWE3 bacterium GW2011_GWF2_41_45]KKS20430.1 MAG: hypothetical protein UU79_C0001G0084 [candidate division WWE3 bacterium GW2011_GWE1_41_72]KKS27475.1 MAG: hypothetical protein UU86_C0019G0002 [candidate division WWE3 bacterium GW2011_GWC1_42_102]KKS28593.1 MAG: hypothetical protein UU90_C0023G0029 [candidate division WWE3 bact
MRIYIGYKYTNVEDKKALIQKLLEFAGYLEKAGHKTFMLGRDIQNWQGSLPLWKTFPAIIGNMLKSDAFVAYVTSPVSSKGLEVEKTLSGVLGKKRVFVLDTAAPIENGDAATDINVEATIEDTANVVLAKLK